MSPGLVPSAIAVTAGVGAAFGPGGRFADRRIAAVRSLCADAAVHYGACGPAEMAVLPEMAKKIFTLFDASRHGRGSTAGTR